MSDQWLIINWDNESVSLIKMSLFLFEGMKREWRDLTWDDLWLWLQMLCVYLKLVTWVSLAWSQVRETLRICQMSDHSSDSVRTLGRTFFYYYYFIFLFWLYSVIELCNPTKLWCTSSAPPWEPELMRTSGPRDQLWGTKSLFCSLSPGSVPLSVHSNCNSHFFFFISTGAVRAYHVCW